MPFVLSFIANIARKRPELNGDKTKVCGRDPEGAEWRADVLVTTPEGERTAFEMQLSSQHLRDFRLRTDRYRRSSVACCWIVANQPVERRLLKALWNENIDYNRTHGESQSDAEDLVLLGVQLADKDVYPNELPTLRFGRDGEMRHLSIPEALDGVLRGLPQWRGPRWHWG